MILVLVNLELSTEIQRFIINNNNKQTKQGNMHLSTASSWNNYCPKTKSFIFPWTNKNTYFSE